MGNVYNFSSMKPEEIKTFIPGYTEDENVIFITSTSGRVIGMKENPDPDAYLYEESEPSYLIVGPNAKEAYIFYDESKFKALCATSEFTLYEFRGKIALSDSLSLSPDGYIVIIDGDTHKYYEETVTELDINATKKLSPKLPHEAQPSYAISLNQYTLPQTWKPLMS